MPGTKRTCRSYGAGVVWSVDSIDMSHLRRWGIACAIWRFFNRLLAGGETTGTPQKRDAPRQGCWKHADSSVPAGTRALSFRESGGFTTG